MSEREKEETVQDGFVLFIERKTWQKYIGPLASMTNSGEICLLRSL